MECRGRRSRSYYEVGQPDSSSEDVGSLPGHEHGALDRARRGDYQINGFIEVRAVVDARNPQRVGRARVSEGYERNQDGQEAQRTHASSRTIGMACEDAEGLSRDPSQEQGCLPRGTGLLPRRRILGAHGNLGQEPIQRPPIHSTGLTHPP